MPLGPHKQVTEIFFFTRCIYVGGISHEPDVSLSLRQSIKHVNCDKRKKLLSIFLYRMKDRSS